MSVGITVEVAVKVYVPTFSGSSNVQILPLGLVLAYGTHCQLKLLSKGCKGSGLTIMLGIVFARSFTALPITSSLFA